MSGNLDLGLANLRHGTFKDYGLQHKTGSRICLRNEARTMYIMIHYSHVVL